MFLIKSNKYGKYETGFGKLEVTLIVFMIALKIIMIGVGLLKDCGQIIIKTYKKLFVNKSTIDPPPSKNPISKILEKN